MIDAILFDNDGVLVDTEGLYFAATRDVLAGVGVTLDEATYTELFLRQGGGPGIWRKHAGCPRGRSMPYAMNVTDNTWT